MRYGRTHDILTGYAMPNTKKKLIRKINQEIDNPSAFYKQFKKRSGFYNNDMFKIPGLTYYPHRKKGGHDWSDMIYFGAKYGMEGIQAYLNHQAVDIISDNTLKTYGSFWRNITEDIILESGRKKYKKFY